MVRNWTHDWAGLARRCLQALAMVLVAAGVGVWAAILLAPAPRAAPPALVAATETGQNLAPVAAWFGAGPASRVKIVPSGLIAAGTQGSAILSVDGTRARAYAVGQALAHDLTLVAVLPTGVVVRQGSQEVELTMPTLPRSNGIVSYTPP